MLLVPALIEIEFILLIAEVTAKDRISATGADRYFIQYTEAPLKKLLPFCDATIGLLFPGSPSLTESRQQTRLTVREDQHGMEHEPEVAALLHRLQTLTPQHGATAYIVFGTSSQIGSITYVICDKGYSKVRMS